MKKVIVLMVSLSSPVFAQESHTRTNLPLTEPQRSFILNEMRLLLSGVQSILAALAENDMKKVAVSARILGFDMKHKAENPMHEILPKDFMRLGMSMHKEFDVIADDAKTKQDVRHSLKQLSEIMAKCTACHATYQIKMLSDVIDRKSMTEPR